jgi:hypothetical protein
LKQWRGDMLFEQAERMVDVFVVLEDKLELFERKGKASRELEAIFTERQFSGEPDLLKQQKGASAKPALHQLTMQSLTIIDLCQERSMLVNSWKYGCAIARAAIFVLCCSTLSSAQNTSSTIPPVIDVHVHAMDESFPGGGPMCPNESSFSPPTRLLRKPQTAGVTKSARLNSTPPPKGNISKTSSQRWNAST